MEPDGDEVDAGEAMERWLNHDMTRHLSAQLKAQVKTAFTQWEAASRKSQDADVRELYRQWERLTNSALLFSEGREKPKT